MISKRRRTSAGTTERTFVRSELLCIFSVAAWIEMTERWFDMPLPPTRSLRMVCNQSPLQLRRLAVNVAQEHQSSSTPLFDHCCAMCGRLLYSRCDSRNNPGYVGIPGPACQVRGSTCRWDAMPLCLLLWSKVTLASSLLRSVATYDPNTGHLRLKDGAVGAPWLHWRLGKPSAAMMRLKGASRLPVKMRGDKPFVVDNAKPWWYCNWCYQYFFEKIAGNKLQRMPMRNYFEGYYTCWHIDIAYPHLERKLRELYPDHATLPTSAEAMQWHLDYERYVKLKREDDNADHRQNTKEVETLKASLDARTLQWSPPPHESVHGTPVPRRFFSAAASTGRGTWSLALDAAIDLVPHEQWELHQDASTCVDRALEELLSSPARAAVSLCRPHSCFVERRRDSGKRLITTQPHQSGELSLRPLTPYEDKARGMLGCLVAKPAVLKERFALTASEANALASALPWLHSHNPWYAAYCNTAGAVHAIGECVDAMVRDGSLLPKMPHNCAAAAGKTLEEHLHNEDVAVFVPLQDLSALTGSWQHIRLAASAVARAQLKHDLPPAWAKLRHSDLEDEAGHSIETLPECVRHHMSFTNISIRDPFFDAKVCVQQYPWGTGSYGGSCDCVSELRDYQKATAHSGDGAFLDNRDVEWVFLQRERKQKYTLYGDIQGKRMRQRREHEQGRDAKTKKATYMQQRFSNRIGHCIPNSPQALRRQRAEVCGASRPGNLGAPTAMTTTVANVHTSELVAHILRGPFAVTDPDDTVSHVLGKSTIGSGIANSGLLQMDFIRRSAEFQSMAYQDSHDGERGRMRALLRRRESQKRGVPHYHYNEYAEPCGKRRRLIHIPMSSIYASSVDHNSETSARGLVPADVPSVGPAEVRPMLGHWNSRYNRIPPSSARAGLKHSPMVQTCLVYFANFCEWSRDCRRPVSCVE